MADTRHQKRLRRTKTSPSKSPFGAGNTEKLPSQISTSGRSRSSFAIFRVSLQGSWPKRRKRHMRGNIKGEWLSLSEQWPPKVSNLGTFLREIRSARNLYVASSRNLYITDFWEVAAQEGRTNRSVVQTNCRNRKRRRF